MLRTPAPTLVKVEVSFIVSSNIPPTYQPNTHYSKDIAKLSPTSTLILVDVSFIVSSYTPPTSPIPVKVRIEQSSAQLQL